MKKAGLIFFIAVLFSSCKAADIFLSVADTTFTILDSFSGNDKYTTEEYIIVDKETGKEKKMEVKKLKDEYKN